jgi:hypothetical protein
MKKTTTLYWIFTGLFAAFMMFTAVPNIISEAESVAFITQLGYPKYFVPFIGVAKALGVIAILIPGFPRIKEWAYSGLFFDLISAVYSMITVVGVDPSMVFMLLPFVLGGLSYYFYHQKIKAA